MENKIVLKSATRDNKKAVASLDDSKMSVRVTDLDGMFLRDITININPDDAVRLAESILERYSV